MQKPDRKQREHEHAGKVEKKTMGKLTAYDPLLLKSAQSGCESDHARLLVQLVGVGPLSGRDSITRPRL